MEVEAHCVDHAHAIQQLHMTSIQHLEMEAMEEEGRDCLSFLATYGAALQACSLEACGVLMCPLQLLMGNMSLATLLALSPGLYCQGGIYPCDFPSNYSCGIWVLLRNQMATPFAHPGGILTMARRQSCRDLWRTTPPEVENRMPLKKLLKGGWQESFVKDSDLAQQANEAYFRTSWPDFNCEVPYDLAGLFWEMIVSASLLDSKI